jgi:cell division protein FtsB
VKRWWPLLALIVLLAGLQAKLWWGDGGWSAAHELRQKVNQQRKENDKLKQRNNALSAEVEDLKSGEAAVEERARSELGMIKPGETFYRVVEPRSASDLPAENASVATPP